MKREAQSNALLLFLCMYSSLKYQGQRESA